MIEHKENENDNSEDEEHCSPERDRDEHDNEQPGQDVPQDDRGDDQQKENCEDVLKPALHSGESDRTCLYFMVLFRLRRTLRWTGTARSGLVS